jgi:hypothetical protein
MHEPANPESADIKSLWRDQPHAGLAEQSQEGSVRRAMRLRDMARSEILMAAIAALFFAAVLMLRLGLNTVAIASLILMAAWLVTTLFWLRKRSWSSTSEAFAASGVEFYRRELEQRRLHLKNAWLWHGPLFLACIAMAGVAIEADTLAYKRLAQVSPLIIALVVWTCFSIVQRRREADAIERELDEMPEASRHDSK